MPRNCTMSCVLVLLAGLPAQGELKIGSLFRIKGQEENTLHGMGLVVGLRGTGDADVPASMRALAQMMNRLGHRIGENVRDPAVLNELKAARNVALVFVTAKVPAGGVREGGRLSCRVNAISAKSLAGGHLMHTVLVGPNPQDSTVYGIAQGPLVMEDRALTTSGRVQGGCRVEKNTQN